MGALFEHVDDAGDRLAVTEPSEGGLTFHCLMDPDWRPGEVWLDPAVVLELRDALDLWLAKRNGTCTSACSEQHTYVRGTCEAAAPPDPPTAAVFTMAHEDPAGYV